MSVAFLVTSLVIVALPGTGALLTVSAGVAHGARASVVTAVGCTLGIVPHLIAAITGTAALLRASGIAFEVVKGLGVAYLLFMAWSTWRDDTPLLLDADADADAGGAGDPSAGRGRGRRSDRREIGSAIASNVLNPKLTIFFFAFLPQFIPAHDPTPLLTMLLLGAVFMAMTFVVFVGYGLFAASVRRHIIDRPRIVRRMRRTFAVSFVALGAKLAATAR